MSVGAANAAGRGEDELTDAGTPAPVEKPRRGCDVDVEDVHGLHWKIAIVL